LIDPSTIARLIDGRLPCGTPPQFSLSAIPANRPHHRGMTNSCGCGRCNITGVSMPTTEDLLKAARVLASAGDDAAVGALDLARRARRYSKARTRGQQVLSGVDFESGIDSYARPASAEELELGPSFGADGGSAEDMVEHYSDADVQRGLTLAVKKLGLALQRHGAKTEAALATMKTNLEGQLALIAALASKVNGAEAIAKAINGFLARADEPEEEEEHDEDGEDTADAFPAHPKKKTEKGVPPDAAAVLAALRGEKPLDGDLASMLAAVAGNGRPAAVAKANPVLEDENVNLGAYMMGALNHLRQ
jgi:hypothetical protein